MMQLFKRWITLLALLSFLMAFTVQCHASYEEDSWAYNRQGMLKVSQGRLNEAIHDFEKACQINPYNDTALANLACARNNLGVIMAQQKKFDEAIRHFEAAKAQKPEEISIRLNLLSVLVNLKNANAVEREAREITCLRPKDVETGLKIAAALQKTENRSTAVLTLQDLASRVPDHAELHATIGRLLYSSGQLDDSAYHLKRSLELNPGDEEVKNLLKQLDRETSVEESTANYTGLHFNLTCPDSFSDAWANEVLELLEEAYEQVGQQLDFYPNQRSQVIIMQTEAFRKVHDLPEWAGGLYDGKIRLPVPARNTRPAAIKGAIMHEYTHHVVYLITSGNCPIWFNEGLAQIFENNHEKLDEFLNLPPGNFKSFGEIDSMFKHNPSRTTAASLYQTALAATAKIVADHTWAKIAGFLEYLGMGYDLNHAATEAFAVEIVELEKACLPLENIAQTE
ncbi:MAG: hypothetical protein CVV42_11305 [Candidatus Riflebacteria bacterium HGW-Riflebacteria-2]|jgi:tetratricopeptide (TPR) repeat protein|nr:MAG: hypothetical protein CVV42_11305 [Candidatus Riflebacteria bacterium HGW-Riflebacteria-2]